MYRQFGFTIIARFANNSDREAYLARCYPDSPSPEFGVVMTEGGESAYGTVLACVGHDRQLVIEPGAVRVDTLRIRGPNKSEMTGEPIGAFEGRMSLAYEVQTCPGDGACRVRDAGRSRPFLVERAP